MKRATTHSPNESRADLAHEVFQDDVVYSDGYVFPIRRDAVALSRSLALNLEQFVA